VQVPTGNRRLLQRFRRRAPSGNTLQSIADNLNGRGIPTKTGKQWAPATIHLLLKRSSLVNSV
jgi:hypothetical protein